MLDGRHVGTGGGNHVVMGAAEPADSPFLRRPDLLKSLLGFWHNHPSLSYLFSGLFIGPSSQHPRIDEARQDSLAELEIAFAQIEPEQEVPPWLVDRLFRHLLADMTGNTHRTEFCIDKLYAPETSSGRLGLVEFRALEMPPHARMSAAQMLLMRAARGGVLADAVRAAPGALGHPHPRRFPAAALSSTQDFADVLEELAAFGFRFDPAWFEPHFEFRFPRIGEVTLRGATLELRHALEPWHVLGEEPAGGGTARYVDSSVERVQARVSGWVEERFVLACNGQRGAADRDGSRRRVCRRRAIQGVAAAAERAASDDPGADAAGVRHLRSLDRPQPRRADAPRVASRRPQLRALPGERQRGGGASPRTLLPVRPHARRDGGAETGAIARASAHAGLAPARSDWSAFGMAPTCTTNLPVFSPRNSMPSATGVIFSHAECGRRVVQTDQYMQALAQPPSRRRAASQARASS